MMVTIYAMFIFVANMHYKIFISNPFEHFIGVQWKIINELHTKLQIQLPAWRPGRYELANYAKNIRCFRVHNLSGEKILFKKITKDCWEIDCQDTDELYVQYEYYANQYDAGGSYADEHQLYVNPVNCLMYVVGKMNEPATLSLEIPDNYQIACQLPLSGKTLYAKTFDELADSPFMASPDLLHHSFPVSDSLIHFWFQGEPCPDIEKLISDTRLYALTQQKLFGDLPCENYHFLYHILPVPFSHGVEHTCSTVITMGPGSDWAKPEFYDNILAISSHEMFHLWNIKRIRPVEMFPYDFTKENYSELGYVYEGITTYYGDLILLRSGAWSFEQYQTSFNSDLQRHITNEGRFNYSISQSSFDTWLDGYVPGVKGRKVSIYMEGMLAALIADITIIKESNGQYRLDDVMKALYVETYKMGKGYTKEMYKSLLERYSNVSFDDYFNDLIDGTGKIEKYLEIALNIIGLKYIFVPDSEGDKKVKLVKLSHIFTQQASFFEIWSKKIYF